jgi:asparagine synthase (glutamine-hydrolysing)
VTAHRYWRPPRPNGARLNDEDYVEGIRHHLATAVRAQLRGAGVRAASQLSAGLDSSAVTVTAARVASQAGCGIIALTAVPRTGYASTGSASVLIDEGPLAAATAALHPNIEHVISPNDGRSPFELLDLGAALFDRPTHGLYNLVWFERLCLAARERGARVVLGGDMGNATISYEGIERLATLARAGRWPTLLGELSALVRERRARPLGALALALQPWLPAAPWQALARARGQMTDLSVYAPLRPDVIRRLDLRRRASQDRRAMADGYESRMRMFALSDQGNQRKGCLAAWAIDHRDPTGDRRLIEFCLAAPLDQFLRGGAPRSLARRAFADRLPDEVVAARRRGWQAADWHEGLTAGRAQAAEAVERIAASPASAAVLDVEALRRRLRDWPTTWTDLRVVLGYREGLIRAIAVGAFLRQAAGDG